MTRSKRSKRSNKDNFIPGTPFRTFHSNGNLCEEGTYIDGRIQGVFREYDESGRLIIQSHWKDDKLNGILTHWRDISTGVLYEKTEYLNDVKVYSCFFDENSMISAQHFYSNGCCIKSIQYKRGADGSCVIATITPSSYNEDYVKSV